MEPTSPTLPPTLQSLWICPEHTLPLTSFCYNCGMIVCPKCVDKEHNVVDLAEFHGLDFPPELVRTYLKMPHLFLRSSNVIGHLQSLVVKWVSAATDSVRTNKENDLETYATVKQLVRKAIDGGSVDTLTEAVKPLACCVPKVRVQKLIDAIEESQDRKKVDKAKIDKAAETLLDNSGDNAIVQHQGRLERMRNLRAKEFALLSKHLLLALNLLLLLDRCSCVYQGEEFPREVMLAFGFVYPFVSREYSFVKKGQIMYRRIADVFIGVARLRHNENTYLLSDPETKNPIIKISKCIPMYTFSGVPKKDVLWDVSKYGFLAYTQHGSGVLNIVHLGHFETASVPCEEYISIALVNDALYAVSVKDGKFTIHSALVRQLYGAEGGKNVLKEMPATLHKKPADTKKRGVFWFVNDGTLYEYRRGGHLYIIAENAAHMVAVINSKFPEIKCACVSEGEAIIHLIMNDNSSVIVENSGRHSGCKVSAVVLSSKGYGLKDAATLSTCGYFCCKSIATTTVIKSTNIKTIDQCDFVYFDGECSTWFVSRIRVVNM